MRTFFLFFWVGVISSSSFAGSLDEYEEKIKEKKSTPSSTVHSTSSSSTVVHSANGKTQYGPLEFLIANMISSVFQLNKEDEQEEKDDFDDNGDLYLHDLGGLTLPYMRVDYNWQYINSNLNAQDVRLELGYKVIGFLGRYTQYSQSDPNDEMTIDQYYLTLRYGVSDPDINLDGLEVVLGIGMARLKGNSDESALSITVPIKYYPKKWIGFEFRPAWYSFYEKMISDYDISTSVGSRFLHFRAGYRWQWVQHEGPSLKGPYLGISLSF